MWRNECDENVRLYISVGDAYAFKHSAASLAGMSTKSLQINCPSNGTVKV